MKFDLKKSLKTVQSKQVTWANSSRSRDLQLLLEYITNWHKIERGIAVECKIQSSDRDALLSKPNYSIIPYELYRHYIRKFPLWKAKVSNLWASFPLTFEFIITFWTNNKSILLKNISFNLSKITNVVIQTMSIRLLFKQDTAAQYIVNNEGLDVIDKMGHLNDEMVNNMCKSCRKSHMIDEPPAQATCNATGNWAPHDGHAIGVIQELP